MTLRVSAVPGAETRGVEPRSDQDCLGKNTSFQRVNPSCRQLDLHALHVYIVWSGSVKYVTISMRYVLGTYLVTIIGVISGVMGMLGIHFRYLAGVQTETAWAVFFLGVLAVYFFGDSIYLRSRWTRESRYALAMQYLNRGFEEIHHLSRLEDRGEVNEDQVITTFERLCTSLANAFTHVTGTKCSVCIKVLKSSADDAQPWLSTLCRDRNAGTQRLQADEATERQEIKHRLHRNTAFEVAAASQYDPSINSFHSNRLPLQFDYSNSSFKIYGEPSGNLFMRWWNWPLPYRSTMVVPIIPSNVRSKEAREELLGFLCVDSPQMRLGLFRADIDESVMVGVADGIYNTLEKFKEMLRE